MKLIPKPKSCHQNWLDMQPTTGGRICGQCQKTLVDFSKMNWSEIEAIHQAHNYAVCGMYSSKQLEFWGREIPAGACSNFIKTTALFSSLTLGFPTQAQTQRADATLEQTIIQGTVMGSTLTDTLIGAGIYLKGTALSAVSDLQGRYSLDLTEVLDSVQNPTLVCQYVGYYSLEIPLDFAAKGKIELPIRLIEVMELSNFSVSKPTFWQRIKWTIRRWFSPKY